MPIPDVSDARAPFCCPACGDSSVVETRCDRCELAMIRDAGRLPSQVAVPPGPVERFVGAHWEKLVVLGVGGGFLLATGLAIEAALLDAVAVGASVLASGGAIAATAVERRLRAKAAKRRFDETPLSAAVEASEGVRRVRGTVRVIAPATEDRDVAIAHPSRSERATAVGVLRRDLTRAGRFVVDTGDAFVLVPEDRARLVLTVDEERAAVEVREADTVEVLAPLVASPAASVGALGELDYRARKPVFEAVPEAGVVWVRAKGSGAPR